MASSGVTFHATATEIANLQLAIRNNCTCQDGRRCTSCEMLATDQRAINGCCS